MTDLLARLSAKLDGNRAALKRLDDYYEGKQAVALLADEVKELVGDRLTDLVLNWPAHALDSLEQRLDVEGFRLGGATEASEPLWQIWQRNGRDEESSVTHTEAMLYGYTAVSVWADPDDDTEPVIATETPHQVAFDFDPATRAVRAALKRWSDGEDSFATLYLPDRLVRLRAKAIGNTYTDPSGDYTSAVGGWKQYGEVANPLGVPPMVPFRHRKRTRRPDGRSELESLLPLADAINKLATDLMVSSEFHALPKRYITGLLLTTDPAEKERLRAEVTQYIDALSKGRTMLGGKDVQFGQLAPADLANFVGAIRMLVAFLAAMGAMAPHEVGITTDNPASAEAIKSSETGKVKRAERMQRAFGGSHEDVMRLAEAVRRGVAVADLPKEFHAMETVWRDAATPTVAQVADAAAKLVPIGVYDVEFAQEKVGMSPQQRQEIRTRRSEALATAATADVEARMALARRLVAEDGMTLNAALAVVGYPIAATANAVPAPAA